MITEDYVSFETAKLLKEKGFDTVDIDAYFPFVYYADGKMDFYDDDNPLFVCEAVTLQMAMKWLRGKKDLYIQPKILNDGTYIAYIYRTDGFGLVGHDKRRVRNNPEDACEAAIKYCLENLI